MSGSYPRRYMTANALRVALDDRARARRRETGENMDLARRRFAFEAFLRRVPRSTQPIVLKGGYLLHMRYPIGPRPTKDLDAAYQDGALATLPELEIRARMRASLVAVAAVPDDDFFTFRVSEAIEGLGADREFVGFRFSVTASIDARPFDTFQVDFTVGDALVQPLDTVTVGEIFSFVEGLPPVQVLSITPAQHLAEKLHAICRDRGERRNNRVKDLFDVVLLLQQGVTAGQVAAVIGQIFLQAGATPLERLREPVSSDWREPFEDLAQEHKLDVSFEAAVEMHRALCRALLDDLA